MSIKVAINGFGRIGRNVFRAAQNKSNIQIVAVNDLTDAKTLGHLLKYDSVLGPYKGEVKVENNRLIVDGKVVEVFSQRDYKLLPWRDLGNDTANVTLVNTKVAVNLRISLFGDSSVWFGILFWFQLC